MEERCRGRLGKRGRFLAAISPVVGGLPGDRVGIHHRQCSFAGLLGFVGAIALPLLGGIFPVLLLGRHPAQGGLRAGLVLRLLGNPIVLIGTYLVFLAAILVYGLFIYQGTIQRAVTSAGGAAIVVVTFGMLRRGALRSGPWWSCTPTTARAAHQFNVVAGGKPAVTPVRLEYTDCVEQVTAASGPLPALSSLCSAAFTRSRGRQRSEGVDPLDQPGVDLGATAHEAVRAL